MNKGEFIDRLSDKTSLTKKEARKLLDSVLDLVQETLLQGEEVKLVGFGKFAVRARKASSRINPQTKRPIQVASKDWSTCPRSTGDTSIIRATC